MFFFCLETTIPEVSFSSPYIFSSERVDSSQEPDASSDEDDDVSPASEATGEEEHEEEATSSQQSTSYDTLTQGKKGVIFLYLPSDSNLSSTIQRLPNDGHDDRISTVVSVMQH